jgi:hypothetical protein
MSDHIPTQVKAVALAKSSVELTAIGIFLCFGATMACFAGTTLLWPGTVLDRAWALNPMAYRQLAPFAASAGVLFLCLSFALATAATGWFKRRHWGWILAVTIISVQVIGDLVNVLRGDFVRGGIGVAIAGALLFYLLRPKVRMAFARGMKSSTG